MSVSPALVSMVPPVSTDSTTSSVCVRQDTLARFAIAM